MAFKVVVALLLAGLVSGEGDIASGNQTPGVGFPDITSTIQHNKEDNQAASPGVGFPDITNTIQHTKEGDKAGTPNIGFPDITSTIQHNKEDNQAASPRVGFPDITNTIQHTKEGDKAGTPSIGFPDITSIIQHNKEDNQVGSLGVGFPDITNTIQHTKESNDTGSPSVGFPDITSTIQFSREGSNRLFYNISNELYDNAVGLARDLVRSGDKYQIKHCIDSLVKYNRTTVAGFAYKLWAAGEKKIVEDVFPPQFRMVFNDSLIKFSNNKYKIPIDYSRFEDGDGDKNLYGKEYEGNSNNYIWKLEPVVDGYSVFFKIRHANEARYIKLGTDMDEDGDYQAYGSSNSDTDRHLWLFQPVNFNGKLSFCIINRKHWQALKLATSVYEGNRKVFSEGSDFYNDPERFGWKVEVITDSKVYGL